ncbi:hypothetical protein R3P38DRAFT_3176553 [Favolaschia claudopus]|uniref:Uncharacterized protein n=1 Tax=Favolaschia claudopus TaxID=2862362 RepID=A0AAW0CY01_9AGAR
MSQHLCLCSRGSARVYTRIRVLVCLHIYTPHLLFILILLTLIRPPPFLFTISYRDYYHHETSSLAGPHLRHVPCIAHLAASSSAQATSTTSFEVSLSSTSSSAAYSALVSPLLLISTVVTSRSYAYTDSSVYASGRAWATPVPAAGSVCILLFPPHPTPLPPSPYPTLVISSEVPCHYYTVLVASLKQPTDTRSNARQAIRSYSVGVGVGC